jgi:signal transduction histidine kinase
MFNPSHMIHVALRLAAALLLSAGCAGWAGAQGLDLSLAERQWVTAHPGVRVVVIRDMEPLYSVGDAHQGPQGFGIDLLAVVAQRAGVTLEYHAVDTIAEAAAEIREGRADLTPMAAPTPRRREEVLFPGPFIPAEQVIVSRSDVGDISPSQDFAGRRVAVVDGTALAEQIGTDFPRANVVHFPSQLDAYRAIAEGQADLAVSWLHEAVYTIEANLLANLRVRRNTGAARSFFGPAVTRGEPLLASIVAKGIASLSPGEQTSAARKWLPRGVDTLWFPGQVLLTPTELAWVKRVGAIKLGYDENFAPFTARGALDNFEGLGADMVRLAATKVGLRVIEQRGGSFADVYEAARNGALNVVVGAARTESRRAEFDFVGPFSSFPTVMVMRSDAARLWGDPDEIAKGSTLGLLREHFLIPQLRSRRPGLPLVVFESQDDVLQALDKGRVDAAIGNGAVINRLINERYAGRLRVTGVLADSTSELYFAVPRAQPELARLLQVGFDAITPVESSEIRQRWLFVSVRPGLHWREILAWSAPAAAAAAFALATLLVANRRLRTAHAAAQAARDAAEEATAARGRFVAYLAHELRGSISGIGAGAQMLMDTDDPAFRRRMLEAMKLSTAGLGDLLETTLAHERAMAGALTLDPQATDLTLWWQRLMAPWQLSAEAKGLALRVEAPHAGHPLLFDGTRLAQALSNLIGNAIKFTASGGVAVLGHWDASAGRLTVRIADSGPGISQADRAQLFMPYSQGEHGRSAGRGAGLGLAICHAIVLAMGGHIEVHCPATGGTEFTVTVPIQPAGP